MTGPRFSGDPVEEASGGRFGGVAVAEDTTNRGGPPSPKGFSENPAGAVTGLVKKAGDFVSQRDEGVDYYSGVDQALFRAGFSRMSNDAEKAGWLDEKVGAGNHGKDSFGAYFIKPEGLKKLGIESKIPVSIDEQRITGYDVADWAGDLPAVVGGAGAAMAASGVGAIPGMALTALGAAGGKAYDEILKTLQGYNKKGPGEMAGTLAGEGAAAATGEGVFRMGARVLKGYGPGNSPKRIDLTREAVADGLKPKSYQFLEPGQAPLLTRFQATAEKVLGDPAAATNREILLRQADDLTARAGAPTGDLGAKLIDKVKTKVADDTAQVDYLKNKADFALDRSLADIQKRLKAMPDPNAGAEAVASIRAARKEFGDNASSLYEKVDEMAGVPFVPTAGLKAQARKIAEQLPKTDSGRVIFTKSGEANPINDILAMPDNITLAQAQRIRSMLGENGSNIRDLVPGVDKRDLLSLKQASDGMFDDAANAAGYTVRKPGITERNMAGTVSETTEFAPGQADAVITALRDADAFYKKGIRKFDAPAIAAITRDARQGGSVDPDAVLEYIIKPGRSTDALRVKAIVPDPVWNKVQRAHFDDMLSSSESVINGETVVSGKKLYDKINGLGKTFDAVYGKEATAIRQYAKELAARDGKLDPAQLQGSTARALETALERQQQLDTFMSDNYLAALSRPGQEAEQAADFIFRPNSPQRINEARLFYGDKSPEMEGLQNQAMQKILGSMVEKTEDPLVKILNGAKLRGELDRYGKSTLEATFGKDLTTDLYKFADVAELVTKKGPMGAGGIVAANVALHPVHNLGKLVDLVITGRLLRTPGVIKWLSEGISADTPPKKAAAALARVSAVTTAIVGDETGSATVNLPVEQP